VDLDRGNGSPDPPRTGHAGRPEAGHGQNLDTGLTGEDYDLMAAVGSGERCVERARPAALFRKSVFFQVKIIKPEILRESRRCPH
jgi:hypothetical protein